MAYCKIAKGCRVLHNRRQRRVTRCLLQLLQTEREAPLEFYLLLERETITSAKQTREALGHRDLVGEPPPRD